MHKWKLPVLATLAYILAGSGWIVAGYFLSDTLYHDPAVARFELMKGLAYVGITAAVFFIALTYAYRRSAEHGVTGDLGPAFEHSLRSGEFVVRTLPVFVVAACISTICILVLGLWWVRNHTLENGGQSAKALQKAHASQFSGALDTLNFTLREIANDFGDSRKTADERDLQRRLPYLAALVGSIGVTDATGQTIHHTSPQAAKLNLSNRDYFQHHIRHPESGFFLSAPLRGEASGRWLIIASRAIRSASGEFKGVVAAVIDPALFSAYWQQTTATGSTISVLQAGGRLLLRSPYREDAMGRAIHPVQDGSPDSAGTAAAVFRGTSAIDDAARVYAVGPVPGHPQLRLMVGLDEAALLQSWRAFAMVSLAIYLLVAGGLAALTFALLSQLRERLVLQRKAAELARYPLQNRNAVITVSPAGKRLFMNHAARELVDSTQGIARSHLDQRLRAMATEAEPGIREFAIGARIFSASYVPHPPEYCDVYLTDVTSVRQDENLLQLFFDLPFIGMAVTSPETRRWLRFNNQLCDTLGYTRAQLEQKTWAELTHPEDLDAEAAEFERVMRDESDGYAMDKRFIRADGAVIDAVIDVHAVRRPDRSVEYFVSTIQDITERKRSERSLREQRNLYAALTDTNEAIIRIRDRNALFQQVCEVAVARTGIVFAWVGMLDDADKLRPVARSGEDRGILEQAMTAMTPKDRSECAAAARALANNRIEVVNDWKDDPGLAHWLELFGKAGFRSLAVLPIRQNGQPVATLHLYAAEQGYFSAEITGLLKEMGADLDYALDGLRAQAERDHAVAELQRAEARWQFALEGGEHGVWEWNIPDGAVNYSQQWKRMLGYRDEDIGNRLADWESLVHPDDLPRITAAVQRYLDGATPDYRTEHRLRCADGSYKWIIDHGKIMTRDAAGSPLLMIGTHTDITSRVQAEDALRDSEQKFKTLVEQSLIGIYMVDETRLLYVNPRAAEIFGYDIDELHGISLASIIAPEDIERVMGNIRRRTSGEIQTLRYEFRGLRKDGQRIDIGVHGSRTVLAGKPVVLGVLQDITERRLNEQRVREYVERLERSIMSTVQAISHMVDLRDPYTSGHERRVGELAAAIGAEIGLSEHQVTGLRIAGNVHDVGKIAVPAEILSKPTRLSAAEFAIVKTHAQQSYEILKDIEFPWPIAQCVWQHHERLDGSGYPQGLQGDAICLEARILAVADVVESMSTHRPYRPALGVEAAFAELRAKSGTLYDPAIVDACIRLFHDKGFNLPE